MNAILIGVVTAVSGRLIYDVMVRAWELLWKRLASRKPRKRLSPGSSTKRRSTSRRRGS